MFTHFARLFIVAISSLMFVTACDNNSVVLSNLSEEQANHALAILHQYNINASKAGTLKSGYSVTVENSQNTTALSIINQYQLPTQSELKIDQFFSGDSLVSSPDIERAKLISLQEQRIEQSLKIIDKVVNAKVNISFPVNSPEMGGHQFSEHAAALITYQGDIDENIFVDRIKLLIKNSMDNIDYQNISVVLFPAQKIQYISPVRLKSTLPGNRLIISIISVFILFSASVVSVFFFKKRKESTEQCGSEQENE
ncbi:TPA: EscJ/YscJ/HrcJ family type III secretion inner membrane ring protein [Escherichia coli]|nr:EscJ/YscJ/HrcJ family type III secretion inner membrane ring protein [Escherichia coli]HBA9523025.1 EscJ/YscJ/HrcJ family type III secretion inner membrane ring protein [Escherichia coli]HBA9550980.1 EscJ/YscJ/HrcJ family type III secretion inner membrane ring protein [Escherichia coli]HBA9560439.1 EscJ/YscJ/HrcJ family type III secretion inner membrane ring protein [Escherichia coli]